MAVFIIVLLLQTVRPRLREQLRLDLLDLNPRPTGSKIDVEVCVFLLC